MTPVLNSGTYVFVPFKSMDDLKKISRTETICEFKEKEGITVVLGRKKADFLKLTYEFIASWITLEIHSSLDVAGLTAVFSTQLANHQISFNVIAGYFHDHIFVDEKDGKKAITILKEMAKNTL